ncbi:MAG: 2-C-methyl-D-erythritol 4-phosphate cytidylyltransferase, partial [Acholeplasmataceae bacterium]
MRYSVVIPAAGQGSRMELGYNKVFYKIGNRTILEKTLAPFIEDKSCVEIILVCSKSDLMKAIDLFTNRKVKTVEGG